MSKSIFDRTSQPYYITAPDYTESSAGIMALHHLCHALNITGFEAYLHGAKKTNLELRTPILDEDTAARHKRAKKSPIAIYPEIISGNPLAAKTVVRFLLNKEGVIKGNSISAEENDIFFYYSESFTPDGTGKENVLTIPTINTKEFKPDNRIKNKKPILYTNRIPVSAIDFSQLPGDIEILSNNNPIPLSDLARKLQSASVLYSFEFSGTCTIAMLCGCPVVICNHPDYEKFGFTEQNLSAFGYSGYTKYDTPDAINAARQSLPKVRDHVTHTEKTFWSKLKQFTKITQKKAREKINASAPNEKPGASNKPHDNSTYANWLALRDNIIKNNRGFFDRESKPADTAFQIICAVPSTELDLLANTLDSLAAQIHQGWVIDIYSDHPTPDGLDGLPCVSWNICTPNEVPRINLNHQISASDCDFVIEIPPGIKFDPLYLWRVAASAEAAPETKGFFVDDDIYASTSERISPRFKPGNNLNLLISSDLAGVLAVRREAWAQGPLISARPWHDQLFHIIETFGTSSISHIPDILLSYPIAPPQDDFGHRNALKRHLERSDINAELLGTGLHSWCIRYPLKNPPAVTIAILYKNDFILEHISRCLNSLLKYTRYPNFDVIVSTASECLDPLLLEQIDQQRTETGIAIHLVSSAKKNSRAALSNAAVASATGEFVLLLDETAQIIQETWLDEIVCTCKQPGIAAVAPRMIQPGSSLLEYAGGILGLNGVHDTPFRESIDYSDHNAPRALWTETGHDLSTLPEGCVAVRKSSYLSAQGMDIGALAEHLSAEDLGLKLRALGERLLYQPLANIVYQKSNETALPRSTEAIASATLSKACAEKEFIQRWWPDAAIDRFWNPNCSLIETSPTPETAFLAEWQIIPSKLPRILAKPVTNGQGVFRISSPMGALKRAGKISSCLWWQGSRRELSPAELIRLSPDSLIVQNYLIDQCLNGLTSWHQIPGRPFTVYALDDLITGLAESNPLRSTVPSNCRERLKYALARCDRMVVSTEYLAESYRHFIRDIRIVPNRLEQEIWLPLHSRKRTSGKPRIGWAGGTTHMDDLLLLKEIIEQTRHEADWIFMGMCPEEIRPLLTENHPFVAIADYPAYLASLNLDIAVAPLADIPFNRAKSNLRLLEYGMLSIPVVCTDIDPYRGSPAFCVPNTSDAWIRALRERIHDADAREQEGRAMRRWVQQNFLLENHLDEWLEAHLPV